MNAPVRGSGATAKQMLQAPDGATFIWVNENIDYPIRLHLHLKNCKRLPQTQRLFFVPRSSLAYPTFRLRGIAGPVILDHAIIMTPHECSKYFEIELINERYNRDKKVVEL
jgi:hypothetical protein